MYIVQHMSIYSAATADPGHALVHVYILYIKSA